MAQLPDDAIDAAASDWVARRDRGLSAEETQALVTWLNSPRHARAFAQAEAVWAALARLDRLPALSLPQRSPARGRAFAAAALAVAACLALGIYLGQRRSQASTASAASPLTIVATTEGQRIVLPDGSVAFLRTASRVEYTQSQSARRLRLEAGEVHVTVSKTSPLPFFVDTPDVVIRDIGTAFDVQLAANGVAVTVTEGEVRLNAATAAATAVPGPPVRLIRGQKAWVSRGTTGSQINVSSVADEAMPAVLAWKSRRLVFDRAPLTEVVRQINQFNVSQLVNADPSLATRPIAGAVQSDNLDGIVHLLKTGFQIQAQVRGNEIQLVGAR